MGPISAGVRQLPYSDAIVAQEKTRRAVTHDIDSMSELEVLAHIDRGMLYSFVWSIPPEVLAERMHVSVDAIQRSCANRGIPP